MDQGPRLTDAHPPREIARIAEQFGVAKARADALTLLVLAILAGGFVSLGAGGLAGVHGRDRSDQEETPARRMPGGRVGRPPCATATVGRSEGA